MSYYRIINGQRYDRKLLELAQELIQGRGDGRISLADTQVLYDSSLDGVRITDVELRTLRYIRDHFRLTEAAADWLNRQAFNKHPVEAAIERVVREVLGYDGLTWEITPEEVERQEQAFDNRQEFPEALRLALQFGFFNGESSLSARDIIGSEVWREPDVDVREYLDMYLNQSIVYLAPLDYQQQRAEGRLQLPIPDDFDQSPDDWWIFLVEIPERTDYRFLITKDRFGSGQGDAWVDGYPGDWSRADAIPKIIEEEFAISGLSYALPDAEIDRQLEKNSWPPFRILLRKALNTYLFDYLTPQSLFQVIAAEHPEIDPANFTETAAFRTAIREKIIRKLDGARLDLIPLNVDDLSEAEREGRFSPPEGESPEDNWIFQLRVPALSDRVFFGILPRFPDDEGRTYNYGVLPEDLEKPTLDKQIEKTLRVEYGLSRVGNQFDAEEIEEQLAAFANERPFPEVLRLALDNLLTSDEGTGPRYLIRNVFDLLDAPEQEIRRKTVEQLEMGEIGITPYLPDLEATQDIDAYRRKLEEEYPDFEALFPNNDRVRITDNWIVYSRWPDLGSFIAWTIIDRKGVRPGYTLGEN